MSSIEYHDLEQEDLLQHSHVPQHHHTQIHSPALQLDNDGTFKDEDDIQPIEVQLWSKYDAFRSKIDRNIGIILALASNLFNSLMFLFCKLLLQDKDFSNIHPFHILFVRMTITFVCCSIYVKYKKIENFPIGDSKVRLSVLLRGVFGFFGVLSIYCSLEYLSLSDTVVINFLGPSLVAVIAWLWLGERLTKIEVIGGAISLVGVMFIARPQAIFGEPEIDLTAGDDGAETKDPGMRLVGILLGFFSVVLSAITTCLVRKIGFGASPLITVGMYSLATCIGSGIGIIVVPGLGLEIPHTLHQWILLLGIGFTGFIMQLMSTASVQREKASRVSTISYTQVGYSLVYDFLFWRHLPNLWSFFGTVVVLFGAFFVIYFKDDPTDYSNLSDRNQDEEIQLDNVDS